MRSVAPERILKGPCSMSHWELKWFGLNITSSFLHLLFYFYFFRWVVFITRGCISQWFFLEGGVTNQKKKQTLTELHPQGIELVAVTRFYHGNPLTGLTAGSDARCRCAELQQQGGCGRLLPVTATLRGQLGGPPRPRPLQFRGEPTSVNWNGRFSLCNHLCFHGVHRNKWIIPWI